MPITKGKYSYLYALQSFPKFQKTRRFRSIVEESYTDIES